MKKLVSEPQPGENRTEILDAPITNESREDVERGEEELGLER
jgi:hypothetical protein